MKFMLRQINCISLNRERKNKIAKPIKNHLDVFFNTSSNQMSIRSRLVSQPNNKLNFNRDQLFNAMDLSPIILGVILPPKLRGQISTNFQNNPGTSDEITVRQI